MNDLEQLGQLWSDYLHTKRQCERAIYNFSNYSDISPDDTLQEYEQALKYDQPDKEISRTELAQKMWDAIRKSNDHYQQLIDVTEQYWIKQVS